MSVLTTKNQLFFFKDLLILQHSRHEQAPVMGTLLKQRWINFLSLSYLPLVVNRLSIQLKAPNIVDSFRSNLVNRCEAVLEDR